MKIRTQLFTVALAALFLLSVPFVNASETVDWQKYSKKLVKSLKSDHEGVKLSAMQQVITYADKVSVDAAIYEIVQVYRTHPDLKVRQLALSTIHKTQNAWAMDFLKRNLVYETSPVLKAQIFHILDDYEPGSVYAKRAEGNATELATNK